MAAQIKNRRPSWKVLGLAALAGALLAYEGEAPAQPGPPPLPESAPASAPTSQPASAPQSAPSGEPASTPTSLPRYEFPDEPPLTGLLFPLGDETLAPTPPLDEADIPLVSDEDILGKEEPKPWQLEETRFRLLVYDQKGFGFQSPAGEPSGPGSEQALIIQPLALFKLRQNEKIRHDITIPVDVVSAASVDALDALSKASRVNEAGGVDVTTSYQPDRQKQLFVRYGTHLEEPFRSWFAGFGISQSLADDNATVSVSGNATFDLFDIVTTRGGFRGLTTRASFNGNISFSQILSPTTLFDASYGLTFQRGTLHTTYNSIPLDDGESRGEELLPSERFRHAIAARLAQHIPLTRSTLKGLYRFYVDDFGLTAHTAEVQGYQYLTPWLYIRGSYRFYTQSGVSFFGESFPVDLQEDAPRTSDSDLAPFDAYRIGLKLVLLGERAPFPRLKKSFFDLSFEDYRRTNDMDIQILSVAYGRRF